VINLFVTTPPGTALHHEVLVSAVVRRTEAKVVVTRMDGPLWDEAVTEAERYALVAALCDHRGWAVVIDPRCLVLADVEDLVAFCQKSPAPPATPSWVSDDDRVVTVVDCRHAARNPGGMPALLPPGWADGPAAYDPRTTRMLSYREPPYPWSASGQAAATSSATDDLPARLWRQEMTAAIAVRAVWPTTVEAAVLAGHVHEDFMTYLSGIKQTSQLKKPKAGPGRERIGQCLPAA
jgi:hypothetical protein